MQDYYKLFGLDSSDSSESIIKDLREILRKERKKNDLSPDGSEEAKASQKNIMLLTEALKIFGKSEKRAEYDKKLAEYKASHPEVEEDEDDQDIDIESDEKFDEIIIYINKLIFTENKAENARRIVANLVADGESDPRLYWCWAQAIFNSWSIKSGTDIFYRSKKALEKVNEGLKLFPANVQLLLLAAELCFESYEFFNAVPYIKKALAIAPTHGGAIGWDISAELLIGSDVSASRRLNRYIDVYRNDPGFASAIVFGLFKRIEFCVEENANGDVFISCQEDFDTISDIVDFVNKNFPDRINQQLVADVRESRKDDWGTFYNRRIEGRIGAKIFMGFLLIVALELTLVGGFAYFLGYLLVVGVPYYGIFYMNKKPAWKLDYEDVTGRGDVWRYLLVGVTDDGILLTAANGILTFYKYFFKFIFWLLRFFK